MLFLQLGRNVAHCHSLCQPFGDGSLSNPRFPHQGWIVLVLPAQNADNRINFLLPPDHRLHGGCLGNQVLAELLQ